MRLLKYVAPLALIIVITIPAIFLRSSQEGANVSPKTFSAAEVEAAREALRLKAAKLDREGPKRFDQPDKAMAFYHEQRLADGEIELPFEHMRDELGKIRAREAAQAKSGGAKNAAAGPGDILAWNEVGPGNIGGRTRAIVFDPVNPDIMYAGGVAGGVFKSTDAGASWNPTDDFMLNLAISTLAIDPNNGNVLYAGTGEGFGTGSPFVRGLGIFKSTDAGATWNQLAGTVSGVPTGAFYYVNKIVISPNDSNRLYAATRYGVWQSLDAGVSWSVVLANPSYLAAANVSNGSTLGCLDIAVRNDRNPDVIFAAFGSNTADGLFRSDDGGASWFGYNGPSHQGRMSIAIAPSNNDVIYLTMTDNGGLGGYGRIANLYRADDGVNFSAVLDMAHQFSPWLFSYVSIATGCFVYPFIPSQGWYDNAIAVDPLDPMQVWVGGINPYRSDNGGVTFGIAGYWFFYGAEEVPATNIHPDQHTIVFHPDYDGTTNQTMYIGNDGGLWRTQNARAATSQEECAIAQNPGPPPDIAWETLNNGYGVTQFYHGDAAKQIDMFVGGAQDNGTSRGLSQTAPNAWDMIYGGDGGYVAIDPTDPDRLYIEIQGFPQIFESLDGGDSFYTAVNGITDTDGLFITPLAMDQSDPFIMWTGGQRPWRTMNGTASWELAGTNFAGPNQISAIAIAPSDGNIVYLGFNNGYVVRSTNALSPSPSWTIQVNGLYGAWVSSMAVDPVDPDVAYLTYSNFGVPHVLKTTNGGANWSSIDGIAEAGVPDIPVHWIAVRPNNSAQLYAATEFGVFASDDTGATWQPSNNGFAHVVVEALDFKDENTLVAFTHGRGVFVANLNPGATGVNVAGDGGADDSGDLPSPVAPSLSASPNPFNPAVTIRASMPVAGRARITVHDVRGREVVELMSGHREAGPIEHVWRGTDAAGAQVASGAYFVRLESPGVELTKKIMLVR